MSPYGHNKLISPQVNTPSPQTPIVNFSVRESSVSANRIILSNKSLSYLAGVATA